MMKIKESKIISWKDQKIAVLQIFFLFVLPMIVLLSFSTLPHWVHLWILLVVTLSSIGISYSEKISLRDLWIRLDTLKQSILPYFIFWIFWVLFTLLLAKILGNNIVDISWKIHYQFGFVITSFVQEFLYRSFLMFKLQTLTKNPVIVIVSNALLFWCMHIIFPHALIIFFLTTLIWLWFATLYYFRPNLIAISLSHSAVNYFAVMHCFASFNVVCL